MGRTLLCIVVVSAVVTLGGCGPSLFELKPAYSPRETPARVEMKSPKRIQVEPFTDRRATETLYEQYARSGVIERKFTWIVKPDVAEVITDAVRLELANEGYQVVEEGEDFVLSGSVLVLVVERESGLFPNDYEGGAQITVALKNVKEHKIAWTETVNGKSRAEHRRSDGAMNEAIKDLVANLCKSESLREALQ